METVWNFVYAKCSLCWWTEWCVGLTWSFSPAPLKGKQLKKKQEEYLTESKIFRACINLMTDIFEISLHV